MERVQKASERRRRRLAVGLALLLCCACSARGAAAAGLGNQKIVLPGFAPIERIGSELRLGERRYAWDQSFLPVALDSRGGPLAGPLVLRLGVGGESFPIAPDELRVRESTPHHVVLQARGEPVPGLTVQVTTRIEYDGVAMVTVTLRPDAPIELDFLDFEADVRANPATRTLRFQSADIRLQRRDHEIGTSYAGPFLNAIAIADGERSFWWFADNAEGWIWNGDTVTELAPIAEDRLRLRQRLIGSRHTVQKRTTFRMNFLVTPVKDLGSEWRRERVTGGVSTAEGQLGMIQGWWSTAFAHTALPFTEPPAEVVAQIPASDYANYPGLDANRFILERNLEGKGIHSLPYFSAHCLSELDPKLARKRPAWEVDPPFVVLAADSSYPTPFEKPVLSQRARGYANYVLKRMDREIDKLGMTGIYLDHASIMDSRNPAHGGWVDSNGVSQPSTDILGMRQFLKRLRTLFYLKGRPGFVFVHASNSELIPAYSFATAIVDGEQFRHRLAGDDYIASVSLDQVRMQNAPGQYGVRNLWTPQFDYFHRGDPSWPGSEAERRAFRNLVTLVLLHDGEFWPSFVPQDERLALLGVLDGFGTNEASFHGYWSQAPLATTTRPAARVSAYRRPGALLLVIGNLSPSGDVVDVRLDGAAAGLPAGATARSLPDGAPLAFVAGQLTVPVPAKDFRLIELR